MADPLADFQGPGFDPQAYLQETLQRSTFEAERARIGDAVKHVERKLQGEVATHHDELVAQVQAVQDMDRRLDAIQASAQQLKLSAQRLRYNLAEPCEQVQRNVVQLRNVWETTDLLRRLGRFLAFVQKLRELQPSQDKPGGLRAVDLPKEAATLRGIEQVLEEGGLRGIDAVDREQEWLRSAGESVRSRATEQLRRSLNSASQSDTRTAVQAFYNLDQLGKVVHSTLQDMSKELRHAVAKELDPQSIIQASDALPGEDSRDVKIARTTLKRLGTTFQATNAGLAKVVHLSKVLQRTRDPATQVDFLSVVEKPGGPALVEDFWTQLATQLQDRMHRIVKRFKALVDEYPAFYRAFDGFACSVAAHLVAAAEPAPGAGDNSGPAPALGPASPHRRGDGEEGVMQPGRWRDACVADVAAQYRRQCTDALAEKVTALAAKLQTLTPKDQASAGLPCIPEVSGKALHAALTQRMTQAALDTRPFSGACQRLLDQARGSPALRQMALSCISAALASFVEICSTAISVRSGAGPRGTVTQGQLCESAVYGALMHTADELTRQCAALAPQHGPGEEPGEGDPEAGAAEAAAIADLAEQVQAARDLGMGCLQRAAGQLRRQLDEALAKLPEADFGDGCCQGGMSGPSPYIQAVADRIASARAVLLFPFEHAKHQSFALETRELARHLVTLFVRLASLARPMSEDGKIRIAQDLAAYQEAVGLLCSVEQLGRPYKELRAFRTALFAEAEQLLRVMQLPPEKARLDATALELTTVLPPVVMLHILVQRAPLDGVPPLCGKDRAQRLEYCSSLDTPEGCAAALDRGWRAMQQWGSRLGPSADELDALLWQSAQAWHQRVRQAAADG
eukprot:TRINITY_DN50911_c0_g1_i1.p1 TRINITY_DN50911_c0_g1~~TRINITY_DN50911_c0_g1_i1.p1  ORF type:complete len:886 (+),score=356.91 TRINITY_DN50911_c0_g1_i1:96-2660(+)